MNVDLIQTGITKLKSGFKAKVNPALVLSSPLSALFKPLDSFKQEIASRQPNLDALILGLSSVEGFVEEAANQAAGIKSNLRDDFIYIPQDEYDMMINGFRQAAGATYGDDFDVSLSSSSGAVYCIHFTYDFDHDFYGGTFRVGSGFAPFCGTGDYEYETRVVKMHATEMNVPAKLEKKETIFQVCVNLMASSELNAMIVESSEAILGGRFNTFISSLSLRLSKASNTVKNYFSKLQNAYANGGIKGVIYFIFSFAQHLSTLKGDDGIFTFTDNNKLIGAEYIAGLIGTIISSVLSAVAMVLAVFGHVFVAIASAIGAALWGIFGSFKYDLNNTYCSIYTPDDLQNSTEAVVINDCLPIATCQMTIDIADVAWYQAYYDRGDTILSLEVVGGYLFMGPGAIDSNHQVTTVNVEFHPKLICADISRIAYKYFWKFLSAHEAMPDNGKYGWDVAKLIDNDDIYPDVLTTLMDSWQSLLEDADLYSYPLNNEDSGHLSSANDSKMRCNVMLCTTLFLIYLFSVNNHSDGDDLGYSPGIHFVVGPSELGSDFTRFFNVAANEIARHNPYSQATSHYWDNNAWNDLISYMTATREDNSCVVWAASIGHISGTPYWNHYYEGHAANCTISVQNCVSFGSPSLIPTNFNYGLTVPKYNASTFWAWIAVAAAFTVAIVTVTVVATVKWAKFKKRKQADNVIKTNDARDNYQKASVGVKTVWNEETQQYEDQHFDVNSEEGKQYIDQCYKNYKRAVFKANIWQKFVGGTRFDTTTFYGDAADTEEAVDLANATSVLSSADIVDTSDYESVLEPDQSTTLEQIMGLIRPAQLL